MPNQVDTENAVDKDTGKPTLSYIQT